MVKHINTLAAEFLAPHKPTPEPNRGESLTTILSWRPFRNESGTTRGWIDAKMPSGQIVRQMKLMRGPAGKFWIAMPAQPAVDKEGRPLVRRGGKAVWVNFVDFDDPKIREKFQSLILAALQAQYPQAFEP